MAGRRLPLVVFLTPLIELCAPRGEGLLWHLVQGVLSHPNRCNVAVEEGEDARWNQQRSAQAIRAVVLRRGRPPRLLPAHGRPRIPPPWGPRDSPCRPSP